MVQPPTLAPAFPAGGATFTLTATVWNFAQVVEGTSEATTLRYYLSTDSAISTSDTQVGTDAVPALGSRGRSTQWVELTLPSTPATYYYGACVDAVTRGVRHDEQLLAIPGCRGKGAVGPSGPDAIRRVSALSFDVLPPLRHLLGVIP